MNLRKKFGTTYVFGMKEKLNKPLNRLNIHNKNNSIN